MKPEVVPGWKTTEFWMTKAAMVVAILMVVVPLFVEETHWLISAVGMAAATLASMGYSYSRGKVKAAASLSKARPT